MRTDLPTTRKRPISFDKACALYVHRFTMDHVPRWFGHSFKLDEAGQPVYYAPHYASDREWYDNTDFPGEHGIGRRENHCWSHGQTWPLGQGLAKPYQKA